MDPRAAAQAGPAAPTTETVRRTPRRAAIDVRANLTLLAVVTLATALQLFGLPILLREWGTAALVLIVPLVVLTPTHWGLIHEAIHGQLFAGRHRNEVVARALAIAFALPFDAVRFGHLMHHRFTREPFDRPDVLDGSRPLWQVRLARSCCRYSPLRLLTLRARSCPVLSERKGPPVSTCSVCSRVSRPTPRGARESAATGYSPWHCSRSRSICMGRGGRCWQ
jgi:fatty acid desaturase